MMITANAIPPHRKYLFVLLVFLLKPPFEVSKPPCGPCSSCSRLTPFAITIVESTGRFGVIGAGGMLPPIGAGVDALGAPGASSRNST